MINEKIRFFSKTEPGQEYKKDWSAAYNSAFPVTYRKELMDKCQIHCKDGILKEIFDLEVYDRLIEQAGPEKQLYCIDLLSAYGDSFLAAIHGMSPEEILEAWSSEEKSLNSLKPRRFSCKTLGVDLSEPALDYGRQAGIFDETMELDINNPSASERQRISEALGVADFVHLGAPGYINLDNFRFIIDAFAAGSGSGVLIAAFNYVFMKHHKEFKQYIVKKLDFINCVGGMQRYLLPEEREYYNVSCAYSTTWVMERKKE